MRIICSDGKVREFIPEEKNLNPALLGKESYCSHCKQKLGLGESKKLKDIWRQHICSKSVG